MRALLLGPRSADHVRTRRALIDAGHVVEFCEADGWECAGVHDRCPLDHGRVDVAVAVISAGTRLDAPGVACVLRSRVPLVTVGAWAHHPINRHAAATIDRIDDSLVDVLEAASRDASGHRQAIVEAIEPTLAESDEVLVEVRRGPHGIDVGLIGNVGRSRLDALADVARHAVRAHDPTSNVTDVRTTES